MPASLDITPRNTSLAGPASGVSDPSNTTSPGAGMGASPGTMNTLSGGQPANGGIVTQNSGGSPPLPGGSSTTNTPGKLPFGMTPANGTGITPMTAPPTPGADPNAGSTYQQIAAGLQPGSYLQQLFSSAAGNPGAYNASALQQDLNGGVFSPGSIAQGIPGAATALPAQFMPLLNSASGQTTTPANPYSAIGATATNGVYGFPAGTPTAATTNQTNGLAPSAPGPVVPGQQPQDNQSLANNMQWLIPLLTMFGQMNQSGPASLLSQLFGGTGTGGFSSGGSGFDINSLLNMFSGGGYNPYNLPLYTRQAIQWPQFP